MQHVCSQKASPLSFGSECPQRRFRIMGISLWPDPSERIHESPVASKSDSDSQARKITRKNKKARHIRPGIYLAFMILLF